MYSPYDAAYGHDTTYIQRMTVEEYVKELQEEEADIRGQSPSPHTSTPALSQENKDVSGKASPSSVPHPQQKRGTRPYEQRRAALSSRNPNVVFSSKYPMYDRLGRELCVAYQFQDMAVQQELRRLELEHGHGEYDTRRSGVRLSAELPMGSDDTTARPGSLTETQPPSLTEGRETAFSDEASRLVRPSHIDGDSLADIEVSATSHYLSVSASHTSSQPASVRPSEFSIFRESGGVVAVGRGVVGKARSSVPVRAVAEEDKILLHRETGGGPLRAISSPSTFVHRDGDTGEGRRSEWRRRSEKRRRSRSSGGRLSRVRFVSEEREESAAETAAARANAKPMSEQQQTTRVPGAAAPLPRRLPTPPPVPLSDPDQTRSEDAAPEEATRWTTLSRGSAAVRATKQLFRSTTHSANASRMTTTLTYPEPIPSNVYGLTAPAIPAGKVRDAVERNVAACAAALPQQYTHGVGAEIGDDGHRRDTPELQCGSVVQLGKEWYRLVHFHVVAEVYEAVRVDAPVAPATPSVSGQNGDAAHGDDGHEQTRETDTGVGGKDVEAETNATSFTERKEGEEQGKASTPSLAPLTSREEQAPTLFATETEPSSASVQKDLSASQQEQEQELELQQRQFFVYRWRAGSLSRGVDEARRAALGLSLCAPNVHVTGFDYADGGGITLVTLPAGYHAVPLSALPLSLRSYTTLLRTVLKALSAMVARRTVHGNVAALGDLFLVLPVVDNLLRTPEASTVSPRHDSSGDRIEAKLREPFIVMFHWEHWVDFGMYVDRNAGRAIPFDFEDSASQALVFYSKDLMTGLQLFLEHTLAAKLTSEQYILLQKLIVLAAEPTPVASHLIQLKNLMLTLPTDTASLQRSFEAALVHYTVE
ncbi:hypothetical protein ABB37_03661 [Leptomonas pyrrhocoris]|uniref:Uncharacterized protein n=1 Tax=Leptomonas pyrrhocoris TaxID=157538 RepID=A0A0M9G328_LEPPY|nr:hypothetical protein ABB37_03661 [Leptomonas pyrrhocoris]KPA81243.1 hypothetical protein ABB37_03661 [Leptomonas pyrrhocoris]|eukprot:XP_015659682.1 hypothetical protein ABB37_03661 [Leptomonas pyrrhocoris]